MSLNVGTSTHPPSSHRCQEITRRISSALLPQIDSAADLGGSNNDDASDPATSSPKDAAAASAAAAPPVKSAMSPSALTSGQVRSAHRSCVFVSSQHLFFPGCRRTVLFSSCSWHSDG